jgi:hypothetical protein
MSVASSRPSTALTPSLPPFALKASFSLVSVSLAEVLAMPAFFFPLILAMTDDSPGLRVNEAVSLGACHEPLNEGYYGFTGAGFAQPALLFS